jgi:hypothetical protein
MRSVSRLRRKARIMAVSLHKKHMSSLAPEVLTAGGILRKTEES